MRAGIRPLIARWPDHGLGPASPAIQGRRLAAFTPAARRASATAKQAVVRRQPAAGRGYAAVEPPEDLMPIKLPTIVIGVAGCIAVIALPYVATALAPPVASHDAFEALSPGMTRLAIEQIVGARGAEVHRDAEGGHERVAYGWTNADGSGMTVELLDGRLVSKSAERLK